MRKMRERIVQLCLCLDFFRFSRLTFRSQLSRSDPRTGLMCMYHSASMYTSFSPFHSPHAPITIYCTASPLLNLL